VNWKAPGSHPLAARHDVKIHIRNGGGLQSGHEMDLTDKNRYEMEEGLSMLGFVISLKMMGPTTAVSDPDTTFTTVSQDLKAFPST